MKMLSAIKDQGLSWSRWLRRLLTWRVEIDSRTDPIALAAFLMALSGIAFHMLVYFRGPVIRSFPPDRITIRPETLPDGQAYVAFVAPMAYVNTGYKEYHGTIKRERLRFKLSGRTYEQTWHRFVEIHSKGTELIEVVKAQATPMPVLAGSSESHETVFLPRLVRCHPDATRCDPNMNYLSWKSFLREIAKIKQLRLRFITEIYNEQPVETACYVDIYPTMRMQLIDQKWVGLNCWEETSPNDATRIGTHAFHRVQPVPPHVPRTASRCLTSPHRQVINDG